MFKEKFKINNIPAVLWGEKSEKVFIAVHGNMSNKEDTVIEILAVTYERLQKEQTIETPIGQNLYWDYYCYVKDNPINIWNTHTDILYGDKDELCEATTIKNFTEKYDCSLEVVEGGEHYFHTEKQLAVFRQWLQKHITSVESK